MGNVYIYLTRRNKSDVRIIGTILSSQQIHASRLNEIGHLGLSAGDRDELKMIVSGYLLEWEPWIESAENYQDLKEKLIKRGINAPPSNTPIFNFKATELPKATAVKLNKNKVMTRRMS
jgi:hypothetical protein